MSEYLEFGDNNRLILFKKADESVVKIKPTYWINIDDVTTILESLVTEYFINNGILGSIFRKSNKTVWDNIQALLDYHNTIENHKLNITDFYHLDIDDLKNLFITQTNNTNDSGRSIPENGTLESSMFAVINSLDFFEILQKAIKNEEDRLEEKAEIR